MCSFFCCEQKDRLTVGPMPSPMVSQRPPSVSPAAAAARTSPAVGKQPGQAQKSRKKSPYKARSPTRGLSSIGKKQPSINSSLIKKRNKIANAIQQGDAQAAAVSASPKLAPPKKAASPKRSNVHAAGQEKTQAAEPLAPALVGAIEKVSKEARAAKKQAKKAARIAAKKAAKEQEAAEKEATEKQNAIEASKTVRGLSLIHI